MASESHVAPVSATKPTIPRRPLGKTGVDVTILTLGSWTSPGLDRLHLFAPAFEGRYIDTVDRHRSAPAIAEWMQTLSKIRKEIFLVTKNHPCTPCELMTQLDRHSDISRPTSRRCS